MSPTPFVSLNARKSDILACQNQDIFSRQPMDKMKQALDNEELSRLYDIQFHMSLAAATKNPFLTQIMDNMSLYEDHLSIYLAVKMQDATPSQATYRSTLR